MTKTSLAENFLYVCRTSFVNEVELLENGPEEGIILLVDLQGAKLGHLTRLNLTLLKQMLFYILECFPAEVIQFHYINIVGFMDKIMALMKQFIKSELFSKIHVHSDVQELEKFFPLKLLPKNYPGGEEDDALVLWGKKSKKKKQIFFMLSNHSPEFFFCFRKLLAISEKSSRLLLARGADSTCEGRIKT